MTLLRKAFSFVIDQKRHDVLRLRALASIGITQNDSINYGRNERICYFNVYFYKTAAMASLTSQLTNHANKTNKTCGALLKSQDQCISDVYLWNESISKRRSCIGPDMDVPVLTDQQGGSVGLTKMSVDDTKNGRYFNQLKFIFKYNLLPCQYPYANTSLLFL